MTLGLVKKDKIFLVDPYECHNDDECNMFDNHECVQEKCVKFKKGKEENESEDEHEEQKQREEVTVINEFTKMSDFCANKVASDLW